MSIDRQDPMNTDPMNPDDGDYVWYVDHMEAIAELEARIRGLEFDLEQEYKTNERLKQLPPGDRQ
jgi:hypothetical protein